MARSFARSNLDATLYRELLALRREGSALSVGRFIPVRASGDVLA